MTAANTRFQAMPVTSLLHIIGATVFAFVGAFQFVPAVRHGRPRWHRFAGALLVIPSGFVVALSGVLMTAAFEMPPVDGLAREITRFVVGALMTVFLAAGVVAIAQRDFRGHGDWMIRAYAIGMGAGTQVLTAIPGALMLGEAGE
ncbi:MAG: DUF2306 domain-containing protein, partial [Pseudoclavibacter sp.]